MAQKNQVDLSSSLVLNLKKGFGVTNPDLREGPESSGLCRHPLVFLYYYSRWCFHSLLSAVIPGWLILFCCCQGAWVGSGFSPRQVKCYSAEQVLGSEHIGSGKGALPKGDWRIEGALKPPYPLAAALPAEKGNCLQLVTLSDALSAEGCHLQWVKHSPKCSLSLCRQNKVGQKSFLVVLYKLTHLHLSERQQQRAAVGDNLSADVMAVGRKLNQGWVIYLSRAVETAPSFLSFLWED